MRKWSRILSVVTAGAIAVFSAASVSAASVNPDAVYGISSNEIQGWPQGPEISSDTGVLMEAETGAVLYDKGADELRYPASITKLMTLLVAVENSQLDEQVTFTETGIRDVTPDSGNIGMQLGEVMTMEDCLYGMIIYSANEVSAQIAEHVGGTEQDFINMMNERAKEIGCTNTHFANASGLPDADQYTTARDMALIFREGLKNETFRKVLNTPTYVIKATNKNSEERRLHTHHPLFAEEAALYYPGCIGGKTGMTNEAGSTLVTGVEQNGVTYITVVLHGADLSQTSVDSRALFDYGYQNFQKLEYKGGSVILPNGMGTDAVTEQEETVNGEKMNCFYISGHMAGSAKTAAEQPVRQTEEEQVEEAGDADSVPLYGNSDDDSETSRETGEESEKKSNREGEETSEEKNSFMQTGLSDFAKILLGIMGFMALLLLILTAALLRKNKKRKHKVR